MKMVCLEGKVTAYLASSVSIEAEKSAKGHTANGQCDCNHVRISERAPIELAAKARSIENERTITWKREDRHYQQ
jgi:hypothetical protein